MPLLKGSATFSLFIVEGFAPAAIDAAAFSSRRFVPLTVEGEAEESAGWVLFDEPHEAPTADRPTLLDVTIRGTHRVVVAYREDKWSIPRDLVKRETRKRIEKIIADEGKQPDEIGRAFVKAVEVAIKKELRGTSRPKTKIVEVEIEGPFCRIFGKGTVVHERVSALLARTLKLDVVHAHPAEIAVRTMAPKLSGLVPTAFFDTAAPDTTDDEGNDE